MAIETHREVQVTITIEHRAFAKEAGQLDGFVIGIDLTIVTESFVEVGIIEEARGVESIGGIRGWRTHKEEAVTSRVNVEITGRHVFHKVDGVDGHTAHYEVVAFPRQSHIVFGLQDRVQIVRLEEDGEDLTEGRVSFGVDRLKEEALKLDVELHQLDDLARSDGIVARLNRCSRILA